MAQVGTGGMVSIAARAKVNLFLEIVGRRADGYHDIVSVFQEVTLADEVRALPAEDGVITCTCTDPELPVGEENLAVRAVSRLAEEAGLNRGICLHLEKRIPVGSGLGGGSSDAAASLRAACQVWGLPEEREVLARIAAELGSDVPFFLWGGTCLCEGRGERVTPVDRQGELDLMLVLPPWGISTVAAYHAVAGQRLGTRMVEPYLAALSCGDGQKIWEESYNRFETVMGSLEPRQVQLLGGLQEGLGGYARLSGSGSSVWCLLGQGRETDRIESLARGLGAPRVVSVRAVSARQAGSVAPD